MRADKAKVVDEVWDEERIESFLSKGPMGSTPHDHSKLLHAYRSMRVDDFERFVTKFRSQGGDTAAVDEQGRTLVEVIGTHAKSAPFIEILEQTGPS